MEKELLTLKEVCEYTGLGQTKMREIMRRPETIFTVRIGNRLYAKKSLLDSYLEKCAKMNIPIR